MELTGIDIVGCGAVSPAGWGADALQRVCGSREACPVTRIECPGARDPLAVRRVPRPESRFPWQAHPRLRRSSRISLHTVAASLEALGPHQEAVRTGATELGIVFTSWTGSVNYSRRFYEEVLKDPATASPIVFPETVFNAPASHLATYLGSRTLNYTLIGDSGSFLQGLAIGADWLLDGKVDQCLVIGAEELEPLVAGAVHLFDSEVIVGEGAGALLLERAQGRPEAVRLDCITEPVPYTGGVTRVSATVQTRRVIDPGDRAAALFDSRLGVARLDAAETDAWSDWPGPRTSVRSLLGEAFGAASAWQCVQASNELRQGRSRQAIVNVVNGNQQAIAARFLVPGEP